MAGRSLLIAALLGSAAALLSWWSATREPAGAGPAAPASAPAPAGEGTAAPEPHDPAADPAAPEPPAESVAFGERVRRFVGQAEELDVATRESRAAELRAEVLRREAAGSLLPAESAYLQLALLRVTVDDPAALERRSRALLETYQQRSEAGWAEYRAAEDPRHEAYRRAEAELVRRARGDGPDALSPDELRRRLQALRAQYYDGTGSLQ